MRSSTHHPFGRICAALAICVVLGAASQASANEPAPAAAVATPTDPVPRDKYWGQIQGLMLGVTITHCQQPLAAWLEDDIEFRDKHVISIGGCFLYGASFTMAMKRWRPSLWINILGPAIGLTSVTTGWILSEAGTINAEVRPDTYQIMGGILQMAALYRSIQLVRAGKPAKRTGVQLTAGPGRVGIFARW